MKNKSFPIYDELAQVFGKDRANVEGVEGVEGVEIPTDAVVEIANDEENSTFQQLEQQKDNLEYEGSPTINTQSADASSRGSKRIKNISIGNCKKTCILIAKN